MGRESKDKDGVMLEEMGNALIDLEVKFRNSTLQERVAMRPMLEELLGDCARYRLRLLKEGIITTEEDLKEMLLIKKEVDRAANRQGLLKAIARTIGFVATKI